MTQIEKCQEGHLDYLAWCRASDEKLAQGERQRFCATCQRWKWQDERCELFKPDENVEYVENWP